MIQSERRRTEQGKNQQCGRLVYLGKLFKLKLWRRASTRPEIAEDGVSRLFHPSVHIPRRFLHKYPSIAQLEERGTVIGSNSAKKSRGHWFDPGSKDFLRYPIVLFRLKRRRRSGRSKVEATEHADGPETRPPTDCLDR